MAECKLSHDDCNLYVAAEYQLVSSNYPSRTGGVAIAYQDNIYMVSHIVWSVRLQLGHELQEAILNVMSSILVKL